MRDEDLIEFSVGAELAPVLPLIQLELERMADSVDARVYRALDDGVLTQEGAMHAWMEKRAYDRLMKRLTTKVEVGKSAASKMAPNMAIGGENG